MMKQYNLSVRNMIAELYSRHGARKIVSLKRVSFKSWLHKLLGRLFHKMLDDTVYGRKDAYGSFSVDSSHHKFNRCRLVDDIGDVRSQ